MDEQVDENLERLRTAFPGLVWTEREGVCVGSTTALADGVPTFAVSVGTRDGALHTVHTWGSIVARSGVRTLDHAPLLRIGRVIAAEAQCLAARAAAFALTARMLRRASTGPREWAAGVVDKEYGIFSAKTRYDAIDLAVEGALEGVYSSGENPGTVDVEIYEDPQWCEKAPQFCDEHEHSEKHPRWLDEAGVTIEVELYYIDTEDEDSNLEWREVTDG
jgi:hypothetical protein